MKLQKITLLHFIFGLLAGPALLMQNAEAQETFTTKTINSAITDGLTWIVHFDVDKDSHRDIVVGQGNRGGSTHPMLAWYESPDFKTRHDLSHS